MKSPAENRLARLESARPQDPIAALSVEMLSALIKALQPDADFEMMMEAER